MLAIEVRAATQGEAMALHVTAGDLVCVYRGLSLADDRPIAVFESLFPSARLPNIGSVLQKTSSVTEALRAEGVADYTRASTRLTAVRANATQALHLHIAEGDPLLRSSGVNVDATDLPVEYGRTWFAGDRVTLTLEDPKAPKTQAPLTFDRVPKF